VGQSYISRSWALDAQKLRTFYGELFGWSVNADNQWNYGSVDRAENLSRQGIGIGGGIGAVAAARLPPRG
jgi:hypothetical protein